MAQTSTPEALIYQYLAGTCPHTATEIQNSLFPGGDIAVVQSALEQLMRDNKVELYNAPQTNDSTKTLFRIKPVTGSQGGMF